jgi:hypothetical protein
MNAYNEHQFRTKIDAALKRIRTVLDNTRDPRLPADVPHQYEDKYLLAEIVGTVGTASMLQCLELIGLSAEGLADLRAWAKTRSVTLRLTAREDCRFDREESRKVESPEHVVETRGLLGKSTRTEKVVVTVTEYFWRFDFSYEIVAFQGNAPDNAIALLTRTGGVEIKTAANKTPRPSTVVRPPVDADLSWFLARVDEEGRPTFGIDRAAAECHTPRRNPEVEAALRAFEAIHAWGSRVSSYFLSDLFTAQADHGRDLSAITAAGLFVPVVPFFEGGARSDGEGIAPTFHVNALLEEERRNLAEKCRALSAAFPKDNSIITAVEAGLLVTVLHAKAIAEHFKDSVDHIEDMLRKQLIAAIGKEVTPAEFTAFMDFHHRKLVKEPYRPKPFSYAVRRPDHDPEGVLGIEAERGGSMPEPVSTTVAWSAAQRPMSFPLDASTRVSFMGDRYLHAWIGHRFSGQSGLAAHLVARARQFSSFILLVGRIASADTFEPKFGVVVHNKDVLRIPLMLEEIPTPKQFRDAIESLSPEQQRFAKAFRGMQLESTLFAVCVIQIKPQLEKLLKLPPDALTKEIRLSQDLLGLFTEYQIPSDLLSYDGPAEAPQADKIARVAEYTARMREMIDLSKKRELEEEREREAMRLAEQDRTPPPTGRMAYGGPPGFGHPPPPMGGIAMPMAMSAPAMGPPGMSGGYAPPAPPPPQAAPAPAARTASVAAPVQPAPAQAPPAKGAAEPTAQPRRSNESAELSASSASEGDAGARDYTKIPGDLDKKVEALDVDSALHATIIHPGDTWTRSAQKGLLTAPVTSTLSAAQQKNEKSKAFDLLDALTKSGALPIEDAALHVVIAATHSFDKTLLETVIQDNVNPIEKVERSLMIVGTTIFGLPASELLADDQRERFFGTSPGLRSDKPALGDGSS